MSGDRYRIAEQNQPYFITLTVVNWIDVFTRNEYRYIIVDALKYAQENKGLIIYAWVIMSNHIHIIVKAKDEYNLSDILRDFKKFTSKQITKKIIEIPESRREWLLDKFEFVGKHLNRIHKYKFWKNDNHAILLDKPELSQQKLDYIHNNPVAAEIIEQADEYIYSSAKFYSTNSGLLKCEKL